MLKTRSPRCFIVAVVCMLAVPSVAGAATITVDTAGDGSTGCTLRGAIESASNDGNMHNCVASGVYGDDTITVPASIGPVIQLGSPGRLMPSGANAITINGPGASSLDVRAAANDAAFASSGTPTVTISGMTISHGAFSGSSGGAVMVNSSGNVTLDHVVVSGNSVTLNPSSGSGSAMGGGVYNYGTLTVTNSTITDNSATITGGTGSVDADGAGIYSAGALTIRNSTISNNTARATQTSASYTAAAYGAAVYQSSSSPLVIDSSTINGNTAQASTPTLAGLAQGGAIQVNSGSGNTFLLERSTISGNHATGQGFGIAGGVYTGAAGGSTFRSDTITQNSVTGTTVNGANVRGTGITFQNTLVSNPQGGASCFLGGSSSGGYNLEDGNSCGFNQATDQVNVASTGLDPNLANHGGTTMTHRLLPGSPAIDKGKSFGETLDQRGYTRPVDFGSIPNASGGDGADIGAFESRSFTLTVSKAGTGAGTVTSSPSGINCGSTCSPFLPEGPTTLTATASPGSRFAGWSGGGCSGTDTCTVDLAANTTVTATFNLSHTLTVSRAGSGQGTVTSDVAGISCDPTCAWAYDAGSTVTLTAAAPSGSRFAGWSGGSCSGTGTCTVTLNADTSVTATFVTQNTLTVSKAGSGQGAVTSDVSGISCDPTCAWAYDTGTSVTLTATPASGSQFEGWSGGGCSGTGTCTVPLNSDTTVTATFSLVHVAKVTHTLKVSRSGTGQGIVKSSPTGVDCGSNCQQAFDEGTSVTLSATPASGSKFTGWGGACSGTGSCTITMSSDKSVTASFALIPAITGLHLSPAKFVRDGRQVKGKCVAVSRGNAGGRHCTRPIAIVFDYRLNVAARITFTIQRVLDGRVVKGRCAARTTANARARHCTLLSPVRGSIIRNDKPGSVRFTFVGRIGTARLGAGSYRLTATPSSNGVTGKAQSVSFQIA